MRRQRSASHAMGLSCHPVHPELNRCIASRSADARVTQHETPRSASAHNPCAAVAALYPSVVTYTMNM